MTDRKVLIVDDDIHICELLKLYFEKDGYRVQCFHSGEGVLEAVERDKPNLVILDLMLPGKDGYEICREIRKVSTVPIVMLTARNETLDKIVGLELGADDYVAKPFDPKELLARAKAVLRRVDMGEARKPQEPPTERVDYDDLSIDMASYAVTFKGNTIDMPPKELELFYFLASHPNRVFTREQLLTSVWGYDFFGESRTVDVHVKRLREKLDEVGAHPNWSIKTVWGVGYKFAINEQAQ